MAVVPIKNKRAPVVQLERPAPPRMMGVDDFCPDNAGLGRWVFDSFITPGAPLFNARHAHLRSARIGWVWSTFVPAKRGVVLAGECQLYKSPSLTSYGTAIRPWIMRQWFPYSHGQEPHFIITINADIAAKLDDYAFCALIEHELCHAAQDVDVFGEPRFDSEGRPVYRVITHDVEEFVDVVARYGAVSSRGVPALVAAANAGPLIGEASMREACGTCMRKSFG